MNLQDHLQDLKRVLMRCLLVWGVLTAVILWRGVGPLLAFLIRPLASQQEFLATDICEPFLVMLRLGIWGGFGVSLPFWAFETYRFIVPGLYRKERNFVKGLLFCMPLFFFLGSALAYFFVLPNALSFFFSFGHIGPLDVTFALSPAQYISLVTHLLLAFGISFLFPIIMVLLTVARIVSVQSLQQMRRFAIVVFFIIGAVLTPPDVLSQISLALPLWALFEGTLLFLKKREGLKMGATGGKKM